ncbi:MAG: hypothetical protein AAF193_10245, partial [Bacteroidota bacterium]
MKAIAIIGCALLMCSSLLGQKVSLNGNAKGIERNSLAIQVRHINSQDTIIVEESQGPIGNSNTFDLRFKSEGNYEVIFTAIQKKTGELVTKSFYVLIDENTPRKDNILLTLDYKPVNDLAEMYMLWDDEGVLLANVDPEQFLLAVRE